MSDEPKQQRLKPVGPAGMVRPSDDPAAAQKGLEWSNGAAIQFGTTRSDEITGSDNDDLILSNGAESRDIETKEPITEYLIGKQGHDVAVLPGQREDYLASVPEITDYPGARASDWKDTDTLYGRVVTLENINNGQTYNLNGIETVAFQQDADLKNPKIAARNFKDLVQNGDINYVSSEELFKQAESALHPEDIHRAKIAATPEAAQINDQQFRAMQDEFYSNPDNATATIDNQINQEIGKGVIDTLEQQGLDVDSRQPPEPDQPVGEYIPQALNLNAPKL